MIYKISVLNLIQTFHISMRELVWSMREGRVWVSLLFHTAVICINVVSILCAVFCFVVVMSSDSSKKTNLRKRFLIIILIGVYGVIGRTVFQIGVLEQRYTYRVSEIGDMLSHLIMESGSHAYLVAHTVCSLYLTRVILSRAQHPPLHAKKHRLLLGWLEWAIILGVLCLIAVLSFPGIVCTVIRYGLALPLLLLAVVYASVSIWAVATRRTVTPARITGVCLAVQVSLGPYFAIELILIPIYVVAHYIPATSVGWTVFTTLIDVLRLVLPMHLAAMSLLVAGDVLWPVRNGRRKGKKPRWGHHSRAHGTKAKYASLVS